MIEKKEKEKIIELIKQGYSNYKIGKMKKHSPNTIEPIRKRLIQKAEYSVFKYEINSGSFIDAVRNIINEANKVINTNQINEKEKKELEKRIEPLRKVLKSEVDERITNERRDEGEKRDQEWKKRIEQQYVKKEIVKEKEESYENKLKEKNIINENLKNEINKRDDFFKKDFSWLPTELIYSRLNNEILNSQNWYLLNENINLKEENNVLHYYIGFRLDYDLKSMKEKLELQLSKTQNEK